MGQPGIRELSGSCCSPGGLGPGMWGRWGSARGRGTCSAIVGSCVEFVQAPAVPHGELVVVREHGLLAVPHVHTQLVAALGRELVDVVQPCGEEQRMQGAWLWKRDGKWDCGLRPDTMGEEEGCRESSGPQRSPGC